MSIYYIYTLNVPNLITVVNGTEEAKADPSYCELLCVCIDSSVKQVGTHDRAKLARNLTGNVGMVEFVFFSRLRYFASRYVYNVQERNKQLIYTTGMTFEIPISIVSNLPLLFDSKN